MVVEAPEVEGIALNAENIEAGRLAQEDDHARITRLESSIRWLSDEIETLKRTAKRKRHS